MPVAPRPAGRDPCVPEVADLVVGEAGVADVLGHCRAGRLLSALRAHTKAPQKVDHLWRALRPPRRPGGRPTDPAALLRDVPAVRHDVVGDNVTLALGDLARAHRSARQIEQLHL